MFWLLMFLIGINVAALITLVVVFSNKPTTILKPTTGIKGNAISKSLLLTPSQSAKEETILANYKKITEPIIAEIRIKRIQLLEELAREKPDKTVLNSYVEEITLLQKQMQNASVNQYLALKEICTPAQCQKLSTLYYELYGCQGKEKNEGKGMKRRFRGGRSQ